MHSESINTGILPIMSTSPRRNEKFPPPLMHRPYRLALMFLVNCLLDSDGDLLSSDRMNGLPLSCSIFAQTSLRIKSEYDCLLNCFSIGTLKFSYIESP